ncbi:MAG: caspase family protein, partial [Spirochaetes bacterium]|nr:caspase family protein [Spirochaetota bacterium]
IRTVKIVDDTDDVSKDVTIDIRINTKETFKKVKPNDSLVLLVGNNDYREETGFAKLTQCENDTLLLSKLLQNCAKINEKNINVANNLSAREFKRIFKTTVSKLKSDQGLIFTYSGHGDSDGSLMFCDGDRVTPGELKDMINSFPNDTTLILDSCYSGNNDGPFDRKDEPAFKKNCQRIYASLAHMTAKEIDYKNNFFNQVKEFYEDVLGIEDIAGNGYFISLIGYFFAEYNFNVKDNIGFKDIMNYISTKSKQYSEYLALRGSASRSFRYIDESFSRGSQLPKIFPLNAKIAWKNPNNDYIVLYRYVEPVGIVTDINTGVMIGLSSFFKETISPAVNIRLSYQPGFMQGFFFGLDAGYYFIYREENKPLLYPEITSNMIPILFVWGYRYQFKDLKNMLSIKLDSGCGVNIGVVYVKDFEYIPQEIRSYFNFCFEFGGGVYFHPIKNLAIGIDVKGFGLLDVDQIVWGLRIPFVFLYRI